MRLWTIQTAEAWQTLQQRTVLSGEKRFRWRDDCDEDWLRAYDWLCQQMALRIAPRPSSEIYPVWAWSQWRGMRHARPDLRARGHLPAGTKGVCLEIEMPEEQVLLSDFALWHYPLNYWYLAKSEEDARHFEQCCVERGVNPYLMKPLPDETLHERIIASWEKIFCLNESNDFITNESREARSIQATFWMLHLAQVRSTRFFIAR